MEEEEGGLRLSKRFSDKGKVGEGGEVDYKTKAGTAWSHSFLNQKPWHPLSYPNQRRKWIAEQTHAQKQRRAEEVAREFAQEQDFMRQTALVSQKEKEKLEMMKAVSFMYVKPPGYNAESAKAAEAADERKQEGVEPSADGASSSTKMESAPSTMEKKKPRPKDVFGRALPTEEQFEVLKNAPRLETGAPARVKPFAVEIRNVKCLRCGNYGHQSGDRECPLKDAIMPNEENRLKRDDPLTAILAQTESSEPLKWELKQKPGMSPPRGGFDPDDPNQQIVAEDIFDEYGGFLGVDIIPELLANVSSSKHKKSSSKNKRRRSLSPPNAKVSDTLDGDSSGDERGKRSKKKSLKRRKHKSPERSPSDCSDGDRHWKRRIRHKHHYSNSEDVDFEEHYRSKHRQKCSGASPSDSSDGARHHKRSIRHRHHHSDASKDADYDEHHRSKHQHGNPHRHSKSSEVSDTEEQHRSKDGHGKQNRHSTLSKVLETEEQRRSKYQHGNRSRSSSSEVSNTEEKHRSKHRHRHRQHRRHQHKHRDGHDDCSSH